LVEPDVSNEFPKALMEHLQQDDRYQQVGLDGFEQSELLALSDRLPQVEVRTRASKFFNLQQAREQETEAIALLGRSTRSNIRRKLRDYGSLDVEWADNLEQATDIFNELIELHQARWQADGAPGAFSSPRFREFQHALIVQLFPKERLVLFRVRHQGETVGCLLLLVDRHRLLDYLSGFAPFDKKPSPGIITHYLCIEEALRRGFHAYDFLVGDKRHKDNLSTDENQLAWATWKRPCWQNTVIDSLRNMKRFFQKSSNDTTPGDNAS
jgi:CelD/BcsL family acetyltransferase involved in cellulose biosynthesis